MNGKWVLIVHSRSAKFLAEVRSANSWWRLGLYLDLECYKATPTSHVLLIGT